MNAIHYWKMQRDS